MAGMGLLVLGQLTAAAFGADDQTSKRLFRLDDYLGSEELGVPSFSFDGQAVAFTRRRPAMSQVTNALVIPEARSDIWLQAAPGKEVRNLTNGTADGSGWWAPRWSPDGEYLSFLSTRGGVVTVWVWERRADAIRQVSTLGIEFQGPSGGCRWLPGRRLICLAVEAGERSTPVKEPGRAIEFAMAAWQKVAHGELAMSAVDSREFRLPARRLLVLDPAHGTAQDVASILFDVAHDTWWLSPDGTALAFARYEVSGYSASPRNKMGRPASIELRSLDGRPLLFTGTLPANVLMRTISWAPDGRALAFFALGTAKVNPVLLYGEELAPDVQGDRVATLENPARLWRVDVSQGRAHIAEVNTGDIDLGQQLMPPAFKWLSSGDLLFQSRRLSERAQPHRETQPDWWVLGRDGATRKLIPEATVMLGNLESLDGGRTFLGLSKGDVWRVDAATGMARNLTEAFGPPVQRYRVGDGKEGIFLIAGEPTTQLSQYWVRYNVNVYSEGLADYVLDLRSGTITPGARPEPTAVIAAFHASSGMRAYSITDSAGTRLWRGTGAVGLKSWDRLATANLHYQEIVRYPERLLEYKTLNGATVLAKVTLPPDYMPGRKYPLMVESDIGYEPEVSRHLYTLTREGSTPISDLNGKMFASIGYVYVFTSAPTRDILDNVGRGNLLLFTNGLLPAVDAVVAAGLADPERVFLYGGSSFGFGALGVVTQTSRFRAAVAQSSWSDQVTVSLLPDLASRYSTNPFDRIQSGAPYATSDLPFWKNGDHYRRNSPFSYVDRVRTPLLIIQHEFDFLPMSQAEMFFSALVLQRKPARFIRYWGEEHALRMPANLRDSYRQIFAWFDEHGDIERDPAGHILFDGDRAKSRKGRPPLNPQDFTRFGPAAQGSVPQQALQPDF